MSSTAAVKLKKTQKHKDKSKRKSKHSSVASSSNAKNEGTLTYKPPPGAILANDLVDSGDFDWDALEGNEDLELWVVRVPEGLKTKYLENITVDEPSSSRTARIGSVERKNATYDVWCMGDEPSDIVAGDEVKALSCLLPRSDQDGKLFLAPEMTTRHLVISARPVSSAPHQSVHQNPPRHSYPREVLKHRFIPPGSFVSTDEPEVPASEEMEVDAPAPVAPPIPANEVKKSPQKVVTAKEERSETKKRKAGGASPEKRKKKAS